MLMRLAAAAALALILCAGTPVGLASFSGGSSAAQATAPPPLWTEHLLATLPQGVTPFPSPFRNSWIAITADLSTFAYPGRFRSGDRWRESIIVGNERGPVFMDVRFPALSPDGSRVAYVGVTPDEGLPAFLVLKEARIQIQFKDTLLNESWTPVFSPDGRKLAFGAERPDGKHRVGIIDFGQGGTVIDERSVTWGPEVLGWDSPCWSPDSTHVVYVASRRKNEAAARGEFEWCIVTGTEPGASFQDATGVTIHRDGKVAFKAKDAGKWFIVLDGERQASFDDVTEPFFRADGTLVYGVSDGGKHFIVTGQSRSELPYAAEFVVASADGLRLTSWYREGKGGTKQRMVINGKAGPDFEDVGKLVVDPETGTYVYTGLKGGKFQVVTPLGASQKYDAALWRPRIREDGAVAGYVALANNKLWWKVVPLR